MVPTGYGVVRDRQQVLRVAPADTMSVLVYNSTPGCPSVVRASCRTTRHKKL